jgi:hypothetical protein
MTKRERFMKSYRMEQVEELVWAPNMDYWYSVNRANCTLPNQYRDMSCDDIIRTVNASIWRRTEGVRAVVDSKIVVRKYNHDNHLITEIETPLGSVRSVHSPTEGKYTAKALTEHFIKDIKTLKIVKYIAEATRYEIERDTPLAVSQQVGEDGIILTFKGCVPFIQFAKTDAGYLNGYYLWNDHRKEVDELINVYMRNYLQAYSLLGDTCLDVISTEDNMDGTMISPDIFNTYALPFYQEAARILHAKGKLFAGHWCGRTQNLLSMVPDSGLDIVEAIVPKPMADIDLADALDMLNGKVVLQGGIPAVLLCEEGCSREEFVRYIEEIILPLHGRKGFVLGMSDNVPPNADFSRIEMVAKLINTITA